MLPALEAPGGPREIKIKKRFLNILFIVWSVEKRCAFTQRRVKQRYAELCEDERLSDPESHFRVNVFNASLDIIIIHPLQRVVAL